VDGASGEKDDVRTMEALAIGSRLGPYQIEAEIGRGGMGVVYRAVDPVIGKAVAIKVLRPELAGNAESLQRFLSEARAVNAIAHRNIVDVYRFGQLPDGRPYLVMELLRGTSLLQLIIERGSVPAAEACAILEEILAGLGAAHAAGVVHRDLKPSNVYVSQEAGGVRHVKLLDFGIAKQAVAPGVAAPQTRGSRIVGTPGYIAPEQARGEPVLPQTDLYAAGVIAFEMLTGERPFHAESDLDVVIMHVEMPAPAPSSRVGGLDPALDALVLELLAKDPRRRPVSADNAREALVRIRRKLEGRAPPSTSVIRETEIVDRSEAPTVRASAIQVQDTPLEAMPRRWLWAALVLLAASLIALWRFS